MIFLPVEIITIYWLMPIADYKKERILYRLKAVPPIIAAFNLKKLKEYIICRKRKTSWNESRIYPGMSSTNGPGAKLFLAAEVISIRAGYQAWPQPATTL